MTWPGTRRCRPWLSGPRHQRSGRQNRPWVPPPIGRSGSRLHVGGAVRPAGGPGPTRLGDRRGPCRTSDMGCSVGGSRTRRPGMAGRRWRSGWTLASPPSPPCDSPATASRWLSGGVEHSAYGLDQPLQRLQRDVKVLKGHVIFDPDRCSGAGRPSTRSGCSRRRPTCSDPELTPRRSCGLVPELDRLLVCRQVVRELL